LFDGVRYVDGRRETRDELMWTRRWCWKVQICVQSLIRCPHSAFGIARHLSHLRKKSGETIETAHGIHASSRD
jgi:hypothetical protein